VSGVAAEDAAAAAIARAAALIAADADAPAVPPAVPPAWLPIALESGAKYLRTLLNGAAAFPGRAGLRRRLKKLVRALELVKHEADAWPSWMLWEEGRRAAGIEAADWQAANAAIPRLLAAAQAAESSIRPGHGRDRHRLNPGALSYKQICAAIVAVAWKEIHASPLPYTAERTHHACAALWAAAGGDDKGWSGTDGGWQPHLEVALGAGGHPGMWIIRDHFMLARIAARLQRKDP
jgi:hypothetical protein